MQQSATTLWPEVAPLDIRNPADELLSGRWGGAFVGEQLPTGDPRRFADRDADKIRPRTESQPPSGIAMSASHEDGGESELPAAVNGLRNRCKYVTVPLRLKQSLAPLLEWKVTHQENTEDASLR